jgi:hypothetical protein
MQGVKRAIIYGLVPHSLGFCGPKAKATELFTSFLAGKAGEKEVRPILQKFEGAYAYYKLIAESNGISDPLADEVVEAYWIGNELLEKVKIDSFREMVRLGFSRPGLLPEKIAAEKAKLIPESAVPHHSFHVLIIGSVTGRITLEGKMLDLCRVGWGRLVESRIKNQESRVVVEYQPLGGEEKLRLGDLVSKEIKWNQELVPDVKIGDWASFHWNQVCEILSRVQVENLEKYTERTLAILK